MQIMIFRMNAKHKKDNEEWERVLRQWGLIKENMGETWKKHNDMEFNAIPHYTRFKMHGLEKMHAKCYGDKRVMAKLKVVLTKCAQTQ